MRIVKYFFLLILVIIVIVSVYLKFVRKSSDKDLVDRVSKLMVLPNEVTTVATVTDKSKLGDAEFFKKAVNGDKVLLFPNAARAVLYRPSIGKIVDVGPIQTSKAEAVPTPASTVKLRINLALYNGTTEKLLTNKIEKSIFSNIEGIVVVEKDMAKRNDYQETLVVDVNNKYKDAANGLAVDIGGKVADLPEGELKPDADILIILGKNHP